MSDICVSLPYVLDMNTGRTTEKRLEKKKKQPCNQITFILEISFWKHKAQI